MQIAGRRLDARGATHAIPEMAFVPHAHKMLVGLIVSGCRDLELWIVFYRLSVLTTTQKNIEITKIPQFTREI